MSQSKAVLVFWMMLFSEAAYAEMFGHPGGCPRRASVGAVPRFTYLDGPFVIFSCHPIG